MPMRDFIIDLPGCSIIKIEERYPLVLHVGWRWQVRCPHCGKKELRKKSRFKRTLRHHSIGLKPTQIVFHGYKYYCRKCERYFRQRLPGILPWQRGTEPLKREVFTLHTQGVSQKALADRTRLSTSTMERWYHAYYEREHRELLRRDCPRVLGIDEHFFSQREGYATTFCDLAKHKVFDVVKGRSAKELHDFLMSLEGRERVKVVCMDMSETYRSIIRRYFPKARIVSDRFHVIRLIQHQFLKTMQTIDPETKYQRGLLKLLRMHEERLNEVQRQRLCAYFKRFPAMEALYQFKTQLVQLLLQKKQSKPQCRKHIAVFLAAIEALKQSAFEPMKVLGKTLDSWQEEIGRMWRFTKNNGITEGYHRKMKLIQRRAYGFRNFENYRLRVKVLCG